MAKERARLTGAWNYILKADRELPPDQQSTFTLRPLSSGERDFHRDHMSRTVGTPNGDEKVTSTSQMSRALCLSHIESVANFPAGAPRRWPTEESDREDYLDRLEDAHVIEIGTEIFIRSFLGEQERKEMGEGSPPTDTSKSHEA